MAGTITSANASYQLAIPGLYDTPQTLKGYSADRAFENQAVDIAELQLGVDGVLVGGFIPYMTEQTVSFLAPSDSVLIFENWAAAELALQEKLTATGLITLPSTGRKYTLTNGYFKSLMSIPTAGKVLQPRAFGITWGLISSAPI